MSPEQPRAPMAEAAAPTAPSRPSVLIDPLLRAFPAIAHGFAERSGGISGGRFASLNLGPRSGDDPESVRENRRRFLTALDVDGLRLHAPRQVHSALVMALAATDPEPPAPVFEGDGIVTDRRGVALMILAADCVPVLLHDPVRGVIAAVHAGWRGTAGGIARNAVATMAGRFGCRPQDIHAALGPGIGRCCYEVGAEVLSAVAAASPAPPITLFDPLPDGKGLLDLWAANSAQLTATGVPAEQIAGPRLCTACHSDRFFSHRRQAEPTGRGGAVIALLP